MLDYNNAYIENCHLIILDVRLAEDKGKHVSYFAACNKRDDRRNVSACALQLLYIRCACLVRYKGVS